MGDERRRRIEARAPGPLEDDLEISEDVLQSLGDTWCVYNSPGEGGLVITGLTAVVPVTDRERLVTNRAKVCDHRLESVPFVGFHLRIDGDEVCFTGVGNDWRRIECLCLFGDITRAGGDAGTAGQCYRRALQLARDSDTTREVERIEARIRDLEASTAIAAD